MYNDDAFQCSQTGRRFEMKRELDAHLDEVHARRRQKKQPGAVRSWFADAAMWTAGGAARSWFEDSAEALKALKAPADTSPLSVPADESQSHCAVSGERFETFWNCEKQDWHYKEAVMLDVPFGSVPAGALVLANAVSFI